MDALTRWELFVTEEIEQVSGLDAYTCGCVDAEMGEPCEPLLFFAKLVDIEQYVWGWKDTTQAEVELEDFVEGIADDEYHASGAW